MSQLTIIKDLFKEYQKNVMPHNALPVQIQECRRAFYAGAHGVFYSVVDLMSDGDDVTQEDEFIIEEIAKELDNFVASVGAGRN